MDYEKAYKNLVAKIKNANLFAQTDSTKNVLEDILPELRESEDERIRNEIVDFLRFTLIKRGIKNGKEKADEWIAYLEKQKEQKPAEWSEEDETRLTNIIIMLEEYLIHHYSKDDIDKSVAWLKSLRPSWKPSEEQMEALRIAAYEPHKNWNEKLQELYEQLKKL